MATDIDRLLLRNGPVEAWLSNRRGHSIPHEPTVVFSKDTRKVSTAVPVKPATPYRLQWRSLQGHPVTAMATVVVASADVDTTDENAQVEPRKFFMVQTDPETQTCASHTTKRNAQWFHTPSEAGGSVQLRIYMGREQSDTNSLVSADSDSDPPADSEPLIFQFTFVPQPSPPPSPPRNEGKRRRGSPPAPTAKAPKGKKQKLATKAGTGKRKKKVEEQTDEAEAGPSTAEAARPTKEQLPSRDVGVEEQSKGTKSGRKSKRKSKEKTT